jgi:hypothetical protein
MSRFAKRPPFHPAGNFVCVRQFTLNGVDLRPGAIVNKVGVQERTLSKLYDAGKISYAPDQGPIVAETAPVAATPAPVAPTTTEAKEAPVAPAYRVKQAGLGGYKVIDASGQPLGKGYKTKAEAEAEIERLLSEAGRK